ncbi:unnamed protein product [Allacma fusca]|uniref:Potassium channel domain-containing protein n=1 Tax=Allacma fusca TaxID=39272 RepID=A0A8J2K4I6_9HEXA|nr:unnamed protein product [Allacma fusca]
MGPSSKGKHVQNNSTSTSTTPTSSSKCTPRKVKNCIRIFLAHLFSHVGLCILIVSYACAGAFLFERLEADKELEIRAQTNATWNQNITQFRKDCVGELWNITIKFNVLYELNWTRSVDKVLKHFEEKVANTAATDGYLTYDETESKKKWSFSGALLYAVSIITTIGYGDRVPKTEKGKVLTMFYAVIGVPLMLLWLSNIGSLMANTFKFVYSHARCSSSDSKPSRPVHNNKCATTSSSFDPPVSSQVKYSVASKTCETSLVQKNPSVRQPPQRESLKNLDPAAKKVLLECAEYNVTICEDARSRRVLQQLYTPQGVGDCEESSDSESVIDISCQGVILNEIDQTDCPHFMSLVPGSVVGVSGGPCHPSTVATSSRGGAGGNGKHSTPSKIPLLHGESGPDLVDMGMEEEPHDSPMSNDIKVSTNPRERVPISLVLAFVVAYLMVGAACFNAWEGWNLLDSAYFCFITLSTIGLGDLTPGKSLEAEKSQGAGHGQLIFCCLYLVLGLAIIAMSFNLVQEEVVAKVKDIARHIGIIRDDSEP